MFTATEEEATQDMVYVQLRSEKQGLFGDLGAVMINILCYNSRTVEFRHLVKHQLDGTVKIFTKM